MKKIIALSLGLTVLMSASSIVYGGSATCPINTPEGGSATCPIDKATENGTASVSGVSSNVDTNAAPTAEAAAKKFGKYGITQEKAQEALNYLKEYEPCTFNSSSSAWDALARKLDISMQIQLDSVAQPKAQQNGNTDSTDAAKSKLNQIGSANEQSKKISSGSTPTKWDSYLKIKDNKPTTTSVNSQPSKAKSTYTGIDGQEYSSSDFIRTVERSDGLYGVTMNQKLIKLENDGSKDTKSSTAFSTQKTNVEVKKQPATTDNERKSYDVNTTLDGQAISKINIKNGKVYGITMSQKMVEITSTNQINDFDSLPKETQDAIKAKIEAANDATANTNVKDSKGNDAGPNGQSQKQPYTSGYKNVYGK